MTRIDPNVTLNILLDTSVMETQPEHTESSTVRFSGRSAFRPKGPDGKLAFWMAANKEPNAATLEAMQELEEGRGQRLDSVDALFEDLGI